MLLVIISCSYSADSEKIDVEYVMTLSTLKEHRLQCKATLQLWYTE